MTDIILQTYEAVDEMMTDEDIVTLKTLNKIIDEKYQDEIEAFSQAKDVYGDIMATGGHYHPDFKQASLKLLETKTALYQKDEVKTYLALEKKVETKLNDFLKAITERISPHIPTPNALGMVKKGGSCHVG